MACEQPEHLDIESDTIKCCKEYKYLGSYVTRKGTPERDIQNKISQRRTGNQKLNSILRSTSYVEI